MNRLISVWLPVLVAGAFFAGCGGSSSDSDKITKAIQNTAQITDASQCDTLFTDQGAQQTFQDDSPEAGRKDCRDNVGKGNVKAGDVKVSDIKISGDTATATAVAGGQAGAFTLRKVGGDWKIDGVKDPNDTSSTTTSTETTASTPAETVPTDTTSTTATGGSASDGDTIEVEGSVLAWARAGKKGNALAFCGLESASLLTKQTGKRGSAAVAACVKAFHAVKSFPEPSSIKFSDATVSGKTAEVSIKAPGSGNTTRLQLVREGNLWKIDNAK